MLNAKRLQTAHRQARETLLSERTAAGPWIGELASSPLSTATAASALAVYRRRAAHHDSQAPADAQRIQRAVHWLSERQNPDGGWGDTDQSYSNIATTMLALAAFHLAGRAEAHAGQLADAERYVAAQGGVDGLRRRYGADRTFAVPILTNCALAGRADWGEVLALPFELACLPQQLYRFLQLPVVSYAIPALVAIGLARHRQRKPRNPLIRLLRDAAERPSLRVLQRAQPASGGFLEATPLTSFVVMSLASAGLQQHPVVQQGLQFLRASERPDGSWPIDTNLATWNTTLALNALAASGEPLQDTACLEWLIRCQYTDVHPYTGAAPGGWGWSDLSGAVPDADDTAGALLALANFRRNPRLPARQRQTIDQSAEAGVQWLLDLQNSDGGWPTFCRGWGKLPFDRSGADLTGHALRALRAWRDKLPAVTGRLRRATARGLRYLTRAQRPDGSWAPLWFGNQDHPQEENPVYGVSRVLMAYADLDLWPRPEATRALAWLQNQQHADGSWGSVEETALAVEALLQDARDEQLQTAAEEGLEWLMRRLEQDPQLHPAPIGFYFAKLWYYEKLYPLIFTVSALGRAIAGTSPPAPSPLLSAQLPDA